MNQCKNAILMRISLSRGIDHVGVPNFNITKFDEKQNSTFVFLQQQQCISA